MKNFKIVFPCILLALLIIPFSNSAETFKPATHMIGEWLGEGRIIVSWCQQKTLPIRISIEEDGRVTGMVGDASLLKGIVFENTLLLRTLGNPRYLVTATLSGEIISQEKIIRKSVKLIIDIEEGIITGTLRTSGSKFGDKRCMQMTADLFLKKSSS